MSDPFDQFDPYPGESVTGLSEPIKGALTVASAAKRERINDPFSQFDPFPDEDVTGFAPPIGEAEHTSTTGAFARGAARSAAPAIGSLPAIGAGAELGSVAGPFGAIAGGIAGGLGGGYLISKAQDWALSKLPDSWVEALGMSERQEKLDQKYHGTASFLGGLAPYAITMRPGLAPRGALPENATALQRIMANPATAHVFGGGVVGGLELGQELAHGEVPDWTKVAISTGFGVVFNRPTRIGETLERVGQRPFLRIVPTPEAPAPPEPAAEAVAEPARPAAEVAPPPTSAPAPPVTAAAWRAEMTERDRRGRPYPPTVADAADLKVMGPGITEDVFQGSHEQSPLAEQSAKEAKRTEQSVIGPDQTQDIHAVARRMDADLFDRYDTAQIQRSTFDRWLTEHPESTQARRHLDALNAELAELRPQVQAAYRRAAEASGGQAVEPEVPAAPPPPRTIEEQRDAIRSDVTRRLIAAGRPKDEAEAAGALIAARYETRAATLRGARGTAEELYHAEAPEILGPGARPQQILPPRPARPVNEAALSLLQFLAHKGGLKRTADLEAILDKNPTVGRFGKLFRDEGMSVDRAREAASEAGYLVENVERTGKQATVRDLLDAIQNETRGRRVYRPGEEPTAAAESPLGPEPPLEGGEEAPRPPEPRSELMTPEDEEAGALMQKSEKIRAPAVRMGNDVYEGTTHGLAADKGIDKYGDDIWSAESGFTTTAGRFVSPEEAKIIAERAEQLKKPIKKQNLGTEDLKDEIQRSLEKTIKNPPEDEEAGALMQTRPETISSAATKIGDQIYSGKTHGEAFAKAEDELKEKIPREEWTRLLNTIEEGFLTSTGRYVNREEANAIAERAEQINKSSPYYAEGSLASEATELLQRQRPTERPELLDIPGLHIGPNFLSPNELYQIKAYHGSPHDFEKFDISKIGTGEGAQTYGHGLYFAENEGVAKVYAQAVRGQLPEAEARASEYLTSHGREAAIKELDRIAGEERNDFLKEANQKSADLLRSGWEPPSHTYKVAIKADPEHFLDWDKPLSEQSAHVRKALADNWMAHPEAHANRTGAQIYHDNTVSLAKEGGMEHAADQLRQAGIPGIRYLDQGSRTGGEGTHNYVVFDDKLIEITHKDGTPVAKEDRDSIVKELFQQARGKIDLNPQRIPGRDFLGAEDVKPILRLTREANASTFIHESGHQFLAELVRDAEHEAAPDQLKADAQATLKWLGVEKAEDIARRHHEKFATGFEQYLREGTAPSPALARVFAQFKQWLMDIYRTIKGLGQPINEDIRGVFDRLLAEEPQRTVIAPEQEPIKTLADVHTEEAQEIEPAASDAAAARVAAEGWTDYDRLPDDIRAELEAEDAKFFAGHESTVEPGGSPSGGAGRVRPFQPLGGIPESIEPGGGGGVPHGAKPEGATRPAGQGPAVSRQRPASEGPGGERANLGDLPLAPNAAPDLTRTTDSFNVGKDGNVRTENITSVEQFARAIEEAKDRIPGSDAVYTDGQLRDARDEWGFTSDELSLDEMRSRLERAFGGVKDLNKKVAVYRQAIRDQSERVYDLMARVENQDNPASHIDYARERQKFDMMMSVLSSVTTEWGRAGRAFRNLEEWDRARTMDAAEQALFVKGQTGRELYQLRMEAKLGSQLNTPAKVAKFLRDAQKRSFGGMLLEYFINNLISGISTHMTYYTGNKITRQAETLFEVPAAAAIGALRQTFGRQGERVYLGEALAREGAIFGNIPKRYQAAIEAVRTGQPTLLPGQEARPLLPFFGDKALTLARNIQNDPVTFHEVMGDLFSALKGARDGIVGGAALLAAGGRAGTPFVHFHWSPLGQIPDIAIRGVPVLPIGSAIRLPGRLVAMIHSMDIITNYSAEIAARAYREATDQGLSGNARATQMANRTTNPPIDWMEDAHKKAYAATLMAPGGQFVQRLSALINTSAKLPGIGEIRPLKFIDPFVHIGANVIQKAVIERTPIGVLSSEIRADLAGKNGNIAQDTAMARMLVGTALSVAFGSLAMEGYITGSGPSDPAKAATWRLAGYQPHSVRIGDMWYQANRLGPMGMHLGIAADLYDVVHDAAQGEFLTAAAHLQHAVTQNILDESFMRGPSELIRAVDDPGRYGENYLKNIASDFLPFSVGMAQMARAQDPYTRQARTVVDELKRKIPGMSETLMSRRDVWGEEIPNPQALGAAGLTAIYMSKVSNDPVNRAMLDLGIGVAKPERKIRNVELTDQEYDDFARIGGRLAKMRLDTIVKSADWQTWPPHLRHDIIAEVIKRSRTAAEGPLFAKYPHIPRDAADELRKRKTGEVAPVPIH